MAFHPHEPTDDVTGTHPHHNDEDVVWVTEFDEDDVKDFAEKMLKLSTKDPEKPIIIYVDSYGGNIDGLVGMLGVIDSVPNPIVTVCMGKAMSAGAVLLSHGDHRYVTSYARVMLHEASGGAGGNVQDVKVDTAEFERMNNLMLDILAKNCSLTRKQLAKKFTNQQREIYMTAKEAVDFGIADKVGLPRLKKIVSYEVE